MTDRTNDTQTIRIELMTGDAEFLLGLLLDHQCRAGMEPEEIDRVIEAIERATKNDLWQAQIADATTGEPATDDQIQAEWPDAERIDDGVWLIPIDAEHEAAIKENGLAEWEQAGMAIAIEAA